MMVLRYVAFIFNDDDLEQREAHLHLTDKIVTASPRRWQPACRAPGLTVWRSGRGMATPRAEATHGVVLGRPVAGAGAGGRRIAEDGSISAALAAEIARSEGRVLGSCWWGGYVAFLCDPHRPRRCVIRDPTGTIPCFRIRLSGVDVFFSDVADIRASGLCSFKANYRYIRASVLLPRLQKTITGLENVDEVLPGEFWTDDRDGGRAFIWDPYEFAGRDGIGGVDAATAAVREVVESSVWSLVEPFERVAHNIGGLDSSIVFACLATAPSRPEISLINYVTPSRGGDERFYVREMADRYRAPLNEVLLDHRRVSFDDIAAACNQVSPMGFFDFLDLAGDLYGLEEVRRADALFYGVGGDNVFLQAAGLLPVLDYVQAKGVGPGFLAVVANAIRDTRRSAYHVLKAAMRQRVNPASLFEDVHPYIFSRTHWPGFSPDLLGGEIDRDLLHPLLVPDEDVPKGKFFQVLSTCFSPIEYYDQFRPDSQVERIHTYFSQPIVETCLQIPTWYFALGGIERGLARRAFQDALPERVARRLTKSTPTEIYQSFLEDNRGRIREFLLDGILIRQGILCRQSIEAILSDESYENQIAPTAIFGFFNWEAWARNWE
jgi:asparagine synthase (glutamine-hydrolysing)